MECELIAEIIANQQDCRLVELGDGSRWRYAYDGCAVSKYYRRSMEQYSYVGIQRNSTAM